MCLYSIRSLSGRASAAVASAVLADRTGHLEVGIVLREARIVQEADHILAACHILVVAGRSLVVDHNREQLLGCRESHARRQGPGSVAVD